MNTPRLKPKLKANAAHQAASSRSRVLPIAPQSTVANPYALSPQDAAKAVRRAGIVTANGRLTRIYK